MIHVHISGIRRGALASCPLQGMAMTVRRSRNLPNHLIMKLKLLIIALLALVAHTRAWLRKQP